VILLPDLGYRSNDLEMDIFDDNQIVLIHPETRPDKRALISSVRERVERTLSQLWTRFIDRVFSRSWNGLWNTIKLKLVHHNLCKAGIIPALLASVFQKRGYGRIDLLNRERMFPKLSLRTLLAGVGSRPHVLP